MKKQCSKCGEEKELEGYSFKNKAKGWRRSSCKQCSRIAFRKFYKENKEYYSLKNKKYREQYRNWLNEIKLGLSCVECGESHVATLDFHHKAGSKKDFNIARSRSLGQDKTVTLNEIKKCVVLCANCHRKLHYKKLQ